MAPIERQRYSEHAQFLGPQINTSQTVGGACVSVCIRAERRGCAAVLIKYDWILIVYLHYVIADFHYLLRPNDDSRSDFIFYL